MLFVFSLLNAGLEILGKFESEVEEFERNRQELANAEKLFDLSITMHPELLSLQKEVKGLRQIYDIYKAQRIIDVEGPLDHQTGNKGLIAAGEELNLSEFSMAAQRENGMSKYMEGVVRNDDETVESIDLKSKDSTAPNIDTIEL
ncbi:hypothetical protein scyTo_0023819 [Scyliorhinus torazame]|uniref:Uncharacterized protein n=1 Tax=Scyliorhinus torazame TaxID=75743 RepID=A0A401QCR0_SCYTO|nr:hypothetical protein [Scyliorhinus torazame]